MIPVLIMENLGLDASLRLLSTGLTWLGSGFKNWACSSHLEILALKFLAATWMLGICHCDNRTSITGIAHVMTFSAALLVFSM